MATLPEPAAHGHLSPAGHLSTTYRDLIEKADRLALELLEDAGRRTTQQERRQSARIARLLEDPAGLEMVTVLTDQVLRVRQPRRAAERFGQLGSGERVSFLGPLDRTALRLGAALSRRVPRLVMPLVVARVRAELGGFVHDVARRPLARHIRRRAGDHLRLNINLLGEAVLGDQDAAHRLEAVEELLGRPEVNYVSVKISAVCAQINPAAYNSEAERIAQGMARLYRLAGSFSPAKFINLDMEEYRDLYLTVEVFKRLLSSPEFHRLEAGIVLQAYLPDSYLVLAGLIEWARARRASGGGKVKVRLVKGANLAMEQVVAEVNGWVQPPFATKAEVDANYKRMLNLVLSAENADALRVGVATHNLFEAAWAITLAEDRGLQDMLEMEMLEGMAPSMAAAVNHRAGGLLLYAPVASRADNESVIAYLVRRFDENTAPDNFLARQFDLSPGSDAWADQQRRFEASVAASLQDPPGPRWCQDRGAEAAAGPAQQLPDGFLNQADTDFSLIANRRWIAPHLAAQDPWAPAGGIPAVIACRTVGVDHPEVGVGIGVDPSDPATPAYRWTQVNPSIMGQAIAAAGPAGDSWRATPPARRRACLLRVAEHLAVARGHLIGVMVRDGGKTLAEADSEVSEAIDFARYYAERITDLAAAQSQQLTFEPHHTVAVIPPWNFPLAIPNGGVMASLAAGAAVLLKPAPETVAVAWALASVLWEAGIPRDLLQFVPCADDQAGRRLVADPGVDAVILTGSFETARMFLGWRPDLHLHAETSGKNAIVVTATADLDNAVADLVRSAFGHAGQKCSAASLAILEASVYDDQRFLRQLADAARTLRLGPGWDPASTIGPLIQAPQGPLADAITRLGPGESWLLKPHPSEPGSNLYTPGIKLGVRPGSSFHLTECFGPVLGLMRAPSLDQAIEWQNATAYGLTAGIHALDHGEVERWEDRVEAGNLYINRHITGAIVQRQPFGGWKRSVIGPGPKAGGPNYVASLGTWTSGVTQTPHEFEHQVRLVLTRDLVPTDLTGLKAEANTLRYVPLRSVLLRVGPETSPGDVTLARAAARAVGVRVQVSSPHPLEALTEVTVEEDDTLQDRLAGLRVDKVRLLGRAPAQLRLAVHDAGLWLDDTPVVADARLEALRWHREQAVSETLHRHGNIGEDRSLRAR